MIDEFRGKYFFLSNFYNEGGITNEHRFQAMKAVHPQVRNEILNAPTAKEAKRLGRLTALRPDWEDVKLEMMEQTLHIKFSNESLRLKLIETGDEVLIEGNWWGDRYWGACPGYLYGNQRWDGKTKTWYGENKLGQLLMKLRKDYGVTS